MSMKYPTELKTHKALAVLSNRGASSALTYPCPKNSEQKKKDERSYVLYIIFHTHVLGLIKCSIGRQLGVGTEALLNLFCQNRALKHCCYPFVLVAQVTDVIITLAIKGLEQN